MPSQTNTPAPSLISLLNDIVAKPQERYPASLLTINTDFREPAIYLTKNSAIGVNRSDRLLIIFPYVFVITLRIH